MNKETYQKNLKRYGTLASLPIMVSILHLLFTVFYISTLSFHEGTNTFGNLYVLGELFASSSFTAMLSGNSKSLAMVRILPSLIGVGVALVLIFLSSFAVKGKKNYFYLSFVVYGVDTLFLIPSFILSLIKYSPIQYQVYDYILSVVIHLVFLGLFLYGTFVARRLDEYERKASLEANTIHMEGEK